MAVLAVSFLLRAAGDVSEGLTARLSPLGWVQKGAAFGENTLIPPMVPVAAAAALHVAVGLGLGLSRAFTLGEPGPIGGLLIASLRYLPASIALVSAGVLAHGCAPNWVAVVWALFSVCIVLGLMGRPLKIPQWLLNLSPFQHARNYPDTSLPPALVPIVLVAAVLSGLGLVRFNRRDLA